LEAAGRRRGRHPALAEIWFLYFDGTTLAHVQTYS
jgi:hypothetical protein